jgi:hypothetical protein
VLFNDVYWVFVGDSDSPRSVVGVSLIPMGAWSRLDGYCGIVGDKYSNSPSGVVGMSAIRTRGGLDHACAERQVRTSSRKDRSSGREETEGEKGGEARS